LPVIPIPRHQHERHEAVDEDYDFVKLNLFQRSRPRLKVDPQIHTRV
jgi:hypothetical protein